MAGSPRRRCGPAPSASPRRARSCTRSKHGLVPGTAAPPDELLAHRRRHRPAPATGVLQFVVRRACDGAAEPASWMAEVAAPHRRDRHLRPGPEPATHPTAYRDVARPTPTTGRAEGARDRAAGAGRPTGMLFGLQSSLHPFFTHPTYRPIGRPAAGRAGRPPARPEVRAALLAEEPRHRATASPSALMSRWDADLPARRPARLRAARRDQRRPPSRRATGRDAAGGRPRLAARAATARRCCSRPLANYVDHDHDAIREMMMHPATVLGLSDGGAHCGLICDASRCPPTCSRTGRATARAGERLPLEHVVHLQTAPHRRASTASPTAASLDARQAGRPQRHRLRRPAPARARDGLRPARRRPPPRAAGRRLPGDDRAPARSPSRTAADRRPPRPPRALRPERPSLIRR